MRITYASTVLLCLLSTIVSAVASAETADLILHNGKIVTVDKDFTIAQAITVTGGKIATVGSDAEVLKTKGEETELVDLEGKMVLPGLIDSHVHASGASMFEFDHPVPQMDSIQDVLDYVKSRAAVIPEGNWIWVSQVFITRLKERRYPTRSELDSVAPKHPVVFRTGPDAALNSLALKKSGIDEDFKVVGAGYLERDPETGQLNGILRGCTRYIKSGARGTKKATEKQRVDRLEKLFRDYNAVGLTTVGDRASGDSFLRRVVQLRGDDRLTLRVRASYHVGTGGKTSAVQDRIRSVAKHRLRTGGDEMVKVIGIKTFLDGGMLTGSAYMRKPWGESKIYAIRDPKYRGVRFIDDDKLRAIVKTTVDEDLQFTAHSVGDGAVHALLDAYEHVNRQTPIRPTRPCITHSNFMSAEAVDQMTRLGVVADIQPAWLYLDGSTLLKQFGRERLRYFQPLATIFKRGAIAGGGSDHMQKIGSLRAINPYNPFLGMWITMAREPRRFDPQGAAQPLHPEQALNRQQAIRFYTANNAYLLLLEDKIGTLEKGKLADLIVIDRDLLKCKLDDVRRTKVLRTYLSGRLVHKQ